MRTNHLRQITEHDCREMAKLINSQCTGLEQKKNKARAFVYNSRTRIQPQLVEYFLRRIALRERDIAPMTGNYLAEQLFRFLNCHPVTDEYDRTSFMLMYFWKDEKDGWQNLQGGHGFNDVLFNGFIATFRRNPALAQQIREALEHHDRKVKEDPEYLGNDDDIIATEQN